MTSIEDLFVKEYEEQKQKYNELEKNKKLVEIELQEKQRLIFKITEFLKSGLPHITSNGFLHISYFLGAEEKERAVDLLKSLGIAIKEETNE